MAQAARQFGMTEQGYLEGEQHSEIRHELIAGQAYAMAGAHKNHGRIVQNISSELYNHLQAPCECLTSDMKVKVEQDFFYPDVVIVCEEEDTPYYTASPILIVEVLSASTRKLDKTLKRVAYQSLPSLQEYVLMEQDVVEIEICRRATHWQAEYYYLGDEIYFASVDVRLIVEVLYARVDNEQMQTLNKSRAVNLEES